MVSQKMVSIWANALLSTYREKPAGQKAGVFKALIDVLKRKKKERFLPAIFKKVGKIYFSEAAVELILARPQSPSLTDKIKKKIQERFGRDKEIVEKIDPAIIAGYRVKTNDLILLSSVKDFLGQIKDKLN